MDSFENSSFMLIRWWSITAWWWCYLGGEVGGLLLDPVGVDEATEIVVGKTGSQTLLQGGLPSGNQVLGLKPLVHEGILE